MDKILIIGLPGSGKSTLANKLGKKLYREVIHLDKFYYKSGWIVASTKSEWEEKIKNLTLKDRWIIEGGYHSTLDMRLSAANTVIFLNFNKFLCLYRIVIRCIKKDPIFGIDKAEGDKNKLSRDLIKKIIFYPRKEILGKLENYKGAKKIFIVKNDKEVRNLLKELTQQLVNLAG